MRQHLIRGMNGGADLAVLAPEFAFALRTQNLAHLRVIQQRMGLAQQRLVYRFHWSNLLEVTP
jgi:hypothetical protein